MILSGNDLTALTPARMEMLHKLMSPTGIAAVFDNSATLEVGRIRKSGSTHIAVFNRGEEERLIAVALHGRFRVSEIWTGGKLEVQQGTYALRVPAHGARLLALSAPHQIYPSRSSLTGPSKPEGTNGESFLK